MKKNNSFFDRAKSAYYWLSVILITLFFFPIIVIAAILIYPVDSSRKYLHLIVSSWAKTILFFCPVMNIHVEGERNLNHSKPYIFVSNHQSIADIIVALHLSHPFKFIAKKELFQIPIFGWAMMVAGYIPLDRGNRNSGKRAVLTAKKYVEQGMPVLFFPEGTRSIDGEIKDFKMGAFKLAAETGTAIVPFVIDGTFNLMPKGRKRFSRNPKVRLKVLKMRKPADNNDTSIEQLAHEVRSEMVQALAQLRSQKEIELTSPSLASTL